MSKQNKKHDITKSHRNDNIRFYKLQMIGYMVSALRNDI